MIKLNPGEKIIYVARTHFIVYLLDIFRAIVLGGAPFFIIIYLTSFTSVNFDTDTVRYLYGGATAFAVIIWNLYFISWTDRVLDSWVITTERIIDIDQKGLFSRNVAVVRLDDIQDIVTDTTGFWSTILKCGTIKAQSSGTSREFDFKMVDNPERVKNIIQRAIDMVGGSRWHRPQI